MPAGGGKPRISRHRESAGLFTPRSHVESAKKSSMNWRSDDVDTSSSSEDSSVLAGQPDYVVRVAPSTISSIGKQASNMRLGDLAATSYSMRLQENIVDMLGDDLASMSEGDVRNFVTSHPELHITSGQETALLLRRCRLSKEHWSSDDSITINPKELHRKFKIMIVGDDNCLEKFDIAELFVGGTESALYKTRNQFPFNVQEVASTLKNARQSGYDSYTLQMWMPAADWESRALRMEMYPATDAFVIIFNAGDMNSLKTVGLWAQEINDYKETRGFNADNVPILLVGAKSSRFASSISHVKEVHKNDAIEWAEEYSMYKYLEICSDKPSHVHTLFSECIKAVERFRPYRTQQSSKSCVIDHVRETKLLMQYLQSPSPSGVFDDKSCVFILEQIPAGTVCTYTLDGTDPTRLSAVYNGPIDLKEFAQSKSIKVASFARAQFQSRVVDFSIPNTTPTPKGHLDADTDTLRLYWIKDAQIHYELNGNPSLSSPPYTEDGISMTNLSPGSYISVIAKAKGMFPSKIATFSVPEKLSRPDIHVVSRGSGSNLCKLGASESVRCRYTVHYEDGRESETQEYEDLFEVPPGAVSISAQAYPSEARPSEWNIRRVTRADYKLDESQAPKADGRRSPRRGSTDSMPYFPSDYKDQPPSSRQPDTEVVLERKKLSFLPKKGPLPQKMDVSVRAGSKGDSSIYISFMGKRLMVSHILIHTPGNGEGPSGYSLFTRHEAFGSHVEEAYMEGDLADAETSQRIDVDMEKTSTTCRSLRMHLRPRHGHKTTKIKDIEVFGITI